MHAVALARAAADAAQQAMEKEFQAIDALKERLQVRVLGESIVTRVPGCCVAMQAMERECQAIDALKEHLLQVRVYEGLQLHGFQDTAGHCSAPVLRCLWRLLPAHAAGVSLRPATHSSVSVATTKVRACC